MYASISIDLKYINNRLIQNHLSACNRSHRPKLKRRDFNISQHLKNLTDQNLIEL